MNMKMEMITARQKFTYAVWSILDKIEEQVLLNPNKRIFDYSVNINVRHQARFLFGMERKAIQFLKDKKIIEEIGEPDIVEFGYKGTSDYQVHENHHFKRLNKFGEFYRQQTNLLKKFTEHGETDVKNYDNFSNDIKSKLLEAIPKGGKFNKVRRMARKFVEKDKVDNWVLASCITPTVRNLRASSRKFAKKDYNREKYDGKIKNCFITLKKLWKSIGYTVKFHSHSPSELAHL